MIYPREIYVTSNIEKASYSITHFVLLFQPTWLIYDYTGTRFQRANFLASKSSREVFKSSVKTYSLSLHTFANFYSLLARAHCTKLNATSLRRRDLTYYDPLTHVMLCSSRIVALGTTGPSRADSFEYVMNGKVYRIEGDDSSSEATARL